MVKNQVREATENHPISCSWYGKGILPFHTFSVGATLSLSTCSMIKSAKSTRDKYYRNVTQMTQTHRFISTKAKFAPITAEFQEKQHNHLTLSQAKRRSNK